jgi:hypothetical protein
MSSWRERIATLRAVTALCGARLLIVFLPFRVWRSSLGHASSHIPERHGQLVAEGERLASHVEWAAHRLPFAAECLPQAMALSWLLRRRAIRHVLVFAVRPAGLRSAPDTLHAWIEIDGVTVLGELPGPWVQTLRLGGE